MGYPSFGVALLQGLLVAFLLLTPWLVLAFGARLKTTGTDIMLLTPVYPVFALLTLLVFLPFEGDWAGASEGMMAIGRPVFVGAAVVLLGTILTQRKNLATRGGGEVVHRLVAALIIGAGWGLVWALAGCILNSLGMTNNG